MLNQQLFIQFPDGKQVSFNKGVTLTEIARTISSNLEKQAIVGRVNETTYDLTRPILTDAQVAIYDKHSKEGLEVIRHSTAHLLAQAVKRLYPDACFGVGPVIENGFYYDIEMKHTLIPEDLITIEKEMKRLIKELSVFIKKIKGFL